MKLMNREALKGLFKKGKFPTESHFAHLIDSSINKVDDGIGKTPADGLQLSPQGQAVHTSLFKNLISIYKRLDLPYPSWRIGLSEQEGAKGLSINKVNDESEESRLFFADNGRLGVKNQEPWATVDIATTLGVKNRVGTHAYGLLPGDGKWQTVLGQLSGVQSFEIVARIDGPRHRGKYAITHAIAVSAYGGKHARNSIRQTKAYYGWFWNRIDFRWSGDEPENYQLQVRTRQDYGFDEAGNQLMIKFHLSRLWDDDLFQLDRLPANKQVRPATTTEQAAY